MWCVLVVSVVSCGSERDGLGRGPYTGWLVHAGAFGLGVCLDDVSQSDAMRTKRASAGTAQRLLRLTVRVVVTMKSCLPASKVGSPNLMESYVR